MGRSGVAGLAAALLALAGGTGEAQELLDDPGFELATGSTQTSNSDWVLAVNFPDGVTSSAQFQTAGFASNPAGTPGTGIWLKPFASDPGQAEPPADASVHQDLPAAGGAEYLLSAWHKQEENYTSASTVLGIEFFDGPVLGPRTSLGFSELELNGIHPKDGSWIQYSLMVAAPMGTDSARVYAEMVDGVLSITNPQSATLDDFSLTLVPEPGGAAAGWLGLAGLGMLRRARGERGGIARRGRRGR